MHLWLKSIMCIIFLVHSNNCKSAFNHHIDTYEEVDFQLHIPTTKNWSAENYQALGRNKSFDAEVWFRALNKDFHLLLYENLEFRELHLEIFHSNASLEQIRSESKFYEGNLDSEASNSLAVGYIHDNIFSGTVTDKNNLYFIEPAHLFFSNSSHHGKIVVYKDVHDQQTISPADLDDHLKKILDWYPYLNRNNLPRGIHKSKTANVDYACQIEMVADHTLYQYFDKDINALSGFLYLHAKYADIIFRRTDFDGDGKPDNIRIVVKKVFIYRSVDDPNYPMAEASDLEDFLKRFALRTQNYCISVCLCYRNYPSRIVGEAYKPVVGKRQTAGGICQKPISTYSHFYRSVEISRNTAVVTVRNSQKNTIPLVTTLLAVTHEIGHAFGSDHDPLDNLYCSPGGEQGYYIMYPMTVSTLMPLSSYFSPCSRKVMNEVLKARGECLGAYPAICGNGVREGDEDCDCGWEKVCQVIDSCCTPSDAKPPEKGCTFRKSKGFTCSPKESPCCLNNCTANTLTDTECYRDDDSCLVSFCNGKDAVCPIPKPAPDEFPCRKMSQTCRDGKCNSTVCRDKGLLDCTCEQFKYGCFICCEKDNECVPAYTIGLLSPSGIAFVTLEGTFCKDFSKDFQCDGTGNCVDTRNRNLNNDSSNTAWWSLLILGVIMVTLIVVLVYLAKGIVCWKN